MASRASDAARMPIGKADQARFPAEQCDALFAAVLVNDRVDPDVRLPGAIHFDYRQEQLVRCFLICRQVWREGVERSAFGGLIVTLLRTNGTLSDEEQRAFKNIRAKFKQLRFAYANIDERHRYPRAFHFATALMGHLQDDLRNRRCGAAVRRALMLRVLMSRLPFHLIGREMDRFRPTSVAGLRGYVADQIAYVRARVGAGEITAKEFHEIRKIVSRQASLYVGLVTLYPSAYHHDVFRYLSAVNGLMGSLHDDLIRKGMLGVQDYRHHRFALPAEIDERLTALVAAYAT